MISIHSVRVLGVSVLLASIVACGGGASGDDPCAPNPCTAPGPGICLVEDTKHRHIYMFNHLEYDATTLRDEYERDVRAKLPIHVPKNYFPKDDPSQPPVNSWRSFAHLMVANWINEVYQTTPFDLSDIGGRVEEQVERRLAP